MNYLTTEDGRSIKPTNPLPTGVYGKSGNDNVQFKVTAEGVLYTNTTANATFTDKSDMLIYPKALEFYGKTAGQTYDVPHISRYNYASTFGAPTVYAGENSALGYGYISNQDGVSWSVTNSTNGNYTQHLYSFDLLTAAKRTNGIPSSWTVDDLKANVKSITVTWVGYGVGANAAVATNGATVKIWNASGTPAWDGTAVGTNTATSPSSVSKAYTASLANYIDSNGLLYILAHSTYASDGSVASTIYTDYVKVDLVLLGSNMNTLNYGIDRQGKQQVQRVNTDGTTMDGNRYEVLVTRVTDYAGKTAGQTYDVPHVMKRTTAATFGAPSAFSTEPATNSYALISTQDGTTYQLGTSTNALYDQTLFSFDLLTSAKRTPGIPSSWTVADLLTNIRAGSITWVGYGVGANTGAPANGATLKVWVPSTSSWADISTNVTTSPSAITYNPTSSAFTARIDAQGFVHLLAHSTYASDGVNPSTIYTDYIKVSMTLVGSVLNDTGVAVTMEEPLGAVTVTAGGTSAAFSNLDISRCEKIAVAINPSATHTYSVVGAPVGRDNVELVAAADRDALVSSASQGKKMSALVEVKSPKYTIYITNGDAADKTYYGRLERKGVRGGQLS